MYLYDHCLTICFVTGGKADKGDSGGGLTFLRDSVHYVYGVVSTKLTAEDKNVRLFTYVLNDGHLAWLRRNWRRLLLSKYFGVPVCCTQRSFLVAVTSPRCV